MGALSGADAGQRRVRLSASDRESLRFTTRSGTLRARSLSKRLLLALGDRARTRSEPWSGIELSPLPRPVPGNAKISTPTTHGLHAICEEVSADELEPRRRSSVAFL